MLAGRLETSRSAGYRWRKGDSELIFAQQRRRERAGLLRSSGTAVCSQRWDRQAGPST